MGSGPEMLKRPLKRVVRGERPCRVCGRRHWSHERRDKCVPSWMDPDDGHAYQQQTWEEMFWRLDNLIFLARSSVKGEVPADPPVKGSER